MKCHFPRLVKAGTFLNELRCARNIKCVSKLCYCRLIMFLGHFMINSIHVLYSSHIERKILIVLLNDETWLLRVIAFLGES